MPRAAAWMDPLIRRANLCPGLASLLPPYPGRTARPSRPTPLTAAPIAGTLFVMCARCERIARLREIHGNPRTRFVAPDAPRPLDALRRVRSELGRHLELLH